MNAPHTAEHHDSASKDYQNYKTEQYFPSPDALISYSASSRAFALVDAGISLNADKAAYVLGFIESLDSVSTAVVRSILW